jgi:hypothetical protein
MLRRCACIALAVMLVGLPTAQVADTTLTLACQGTTTDKMDRIVAYTRDAEALDHIFREVDDDAHAPGRTP